MENISMTLDKRTPLRTIGLYVFLGSSVFLSNCELYPKKNITKIEEEDISCMLDFHETEEMLRILARREQDEVLLMNDGGTWYSLAKKATQYEAEVDKNEIFFALHYSPEPVLYFYHQHTFILDSNSGELLDSIHPPSSKDILFHTEFKKESAQYGKRIVSRVVDMYGVWEYDTNNMVQQEVHNGERTLFSWRNTETLSSLFDEKVLLVVKEHAYNTPSEQLEALLPTYKEAGVSLQFTEF